MLAHFLSESTGEGRARFALRRGCALIHKDRAAPGAFWDLTKWTNLDWFSESVYIE